MSTLGFKARMDPSLACIVAYINGSKRGPPPWVQILLFSCSAVFGKHFQNNRLAHPLWELAPPPQENTGSVTANGFLRFTSVATPADVFPSLMQRALIRTVWSVTTLTMFPARMSARDVRTATTCREETV